MKNHLFFVNFFAFSTYQKSFMALESTLISQYPLLSNPDSEEEYKGFFLVESFDCWNQSISSSMQLSFFGGTIEAGMNLLIKLDTFPVDKPLILLVPDSLGSRTFLAFYSEKARFSSNILFFLTSSYALLSFVLNLLINSPIRSVAPSGGFQTSFFFFPFLDLSSFSGCLTYDDSFEGYDTEFSEGFKDESRIDEGFKSDYFEDKLLGFCSWESELFREEPNFDLSF